MSKFLVLVFLASAMVSACDVRSGTAIKEMEKFTPSPTPVFSPVPTPSPIDPADSVAADTSRESEVIHLNGFKEKLTANCSKFDRVMVNGDDCEIAIKGVCRQIMVNGDRNTVKTDAALEFVFNGTGNTLSYTRFVNGKFPSIVENRSGNQLDRISGTDLPQKNKAK